MDTFSSCCCSHMSFLRLIVGAEFEDGSCFEIRFKFDIQTD